MQIGHEQAKFNYNIKLSETGKPNKESQKAEQSLNSWPIKKSLHAKTNKYFAWFKKIQVIKDIPIRSWSVSAVQPVFRGHMLQLQL